MRAEPRAGEGVGAVEFLIPMRGNETSSMSLIDRVPRSS